MAYLHPEQLLRHTLPDSRSRRRRSHELPHGIAVCLVGQAGVEFRQSLAQGPGEHHLPVRCPAQKAIRTEVPVVAGIDRLPAKFLLEVFGRVLLNAPHNRLAMERNGIASPS